MLKIPVNRWTIGVITAILLIFGNDFIEPVMKAIGIMTSAYVPAV